ncbi:ester cyclase [Bacillus sp. S13(2024)]|uniref:ester cyclase n=1 Tax=unclassified Bacillus (in: firmicutes) TaxID=185979 RepID=UPI003D231DEA
MDISELVSNKKVVENFFKVVNLRQSERLVEFMATDVIDYNKIIHGEDDKPGAAFDGIRQQLAAFNPLHFHIEELIAENSRVVARITQSGVHTGGHPRMPIPTNGKFENEAIYIFTVTNQKISEIRAVSDRLGLFLQLGWDWPKTD